MAVLVNRTQGNFTMISNNILRDEELNLKDRGLLCTLCSLPNGWHFSIAGLSRILPDGKDAISGSLKRLESLRYLSITKSRNSAGEFVSELEVFTERKSTTASPLRETRHGNSILENPGRNPQTGSTVAENTAGSHTDHKNMTSINDHVKSIHQNQQYLSDGQTEEERQILQYKDLIASNIHLDWLLDAARQKDDTEVRMVQEIYDVICDMVCYPRSEVSIKGETRPWSTVKAQFLKLTYDHVASVLERVIDQDLNIHNMYSYLVSTLFSESMTNTMETQANIHDDYLKSLRGHPYSMS